MSYPGTLIKEGSTGENVTKVQSRLNALGFNVGSADGIFGANTKSGVIAFQKNRGLSADGIVGKNTWDTLFPTTFLSVSKEGQAINKVAKSLGIHSFSSVVSVGNKYVVNAGFMKVTYEVSYDMKYGSGGIGTISVKNGVPSVSYTTIQNQLNGTFGSVSISQLKSFSASIGNGFFKITVSGRTATISIKQEGVNGITIYHNISMESQAAKPTTSQTQSAYNTAPATIAIIALVVVLVGGAIILSGGGPGFAFAAAML